MLIKSWCEKGIDTGAELQQAITDIALCDTKKDLTDLKKTTPAYIISDASFIAAGKARYETIMTENTNIASIYKP